MKLRRMRCAWKCSTWATGEEGVRDVAQLIEYRTGTLPTQVRFPGAARDFLPESTFGADSLTVSVHPQCAIACIYTCAPVKVPVVHARVRWIMETLKKTQKNMHCRLSSATLSQLAFPREANPNFPWEKSHRDDTVVKKKVKVKK